MVSSGGEPGAFEVGLRMSPGAECMASIREVPAELW